MTWGDYLSYKARAEAAESERDALREALEKIARWADGAKGPAGAEAGWYPLNIARQALERPE